MAQIKIRGHTVPIDVESELREYDFGYNARWSADKLVASSPFRTDQSPSFFVNLSGEYAGTWGDSGALDENYSRGNFVALIAHLRGIGYDEASDYLLEKYGILYETKVGEQVRLTSVKIRSNTEKRYAIVNTVTPAVSPYLIRRGISAQVQAEYGIGYNPQHKGYTAIPWHYADTGEIATVKYRSTKDKRFFYEKGATPVRKLVYGLYEINRRSEDYAVLVEGEIDALSWATATAGIPAIALGGSHISREQADLIKRSSIRKLYLGGDNDEQGRRLNNNVTEVLRDYVELYTVEYGAYKDANEALLDGGAGTLESFATIGNVEKRRHLCNIMVT